MKKYSQLIFSAWILFLFGIQQNLYAGFFDQLGSELQKGITQGLTGQTAEPANTQKKQASSSLSTGYIKKGSNLRSGPGTTHSKVTYLSEGTSLTILKTQGDWLNVKANTSSGTKVGWVYKPLVTISGSSASGATNNTVGEKNRSNVFYAGYSKSFQKVKTMMANGDLKGVEKFYSDREAAVLKKNQTKWQAIDEIGLLRWMERGTLYLDQGNKDKSIKSFDNAETILKVRQQNSQAEDLITSMVTFAAETVAGQEEFQEYPGEGYEKVMMLNYKSISYLLDGERQAYNVARRAIDWQNMEKARFRDRIEKAKKEVKEQKTSKEANETKSSWAAHYQRLNKIATKVPSAFVNPFGYYITGMIQEYESKDDRSLRDNARIAYQKALDLNPKSKVIKQAVNDMKAKKSYAGKRLVHVVVGDGFAPEKKMLVYNFPTGDGIVPIKLPIYEPVSSKVARIEVQTNGGKRLARLSLISDIEAISLRNQKDTEAFRTLRMSLAIARAVGVNQASKKLGMFGSLVSSTVNNMSAPDMRSWMSLPASIQAARLHLSKNIRTLKIVSFDARGRRLATKKIKISGQDAFVYARSINKQIYVHGSDKLWTAN